VDFVQIGSYPDTIWLYMSTTTAGATIFYTVGTTGYSTDPTHDGSTPTNGTITYTGPVPIQNGEHRYFKAMGYKDGRTDSGVASYEVDNHGQLDRPQSMSQPLSPDNNGLTYDGNGNLTSYKGWTYSYDAQNRLTSASNNGVQVASFYYDGKNRQIARNINGVIRVNVGDDWELIEEYASPASRTAAYLQGANGVIKSWGANGTFYYYQDKLGSTTHIANASGNLLESYRYDLYGTPSYFNALNNQLSTSNYSVNDLYAGERWIVELAAYDLRNRFMSPELGRFLQSDPIGFKGDASNLYRYCHNDPEDFSDPMGLIDRTPSDRIWEMACFFDSGNSFQGSLTEFMQRLTQAGMDGGRGEAQGGGDGATVTGQYSRPGPHEPTGRGAREYSESDAPLRMLPPKDAITEGYDRDAYYQLASRENKPLSGGNLKFQEVATQDRKSDYNINTTTKEPPRELQRGGLYKDHVGFDIKGRPRSNDPPGKGILNVKFRSEYPDGRPGPIISTKMQHVTTHYPDKKPTVGIYVIEP
jgi:RHS repeat-associated protein